MGIDVFPNWDGDFPKEFRRDHPKWPHKRTVSFNFLHKPAAHPVPHPCSLFLFRSSIRSRWDLTASSKIFVSSFRCSL